MIYTQEVNLCKSDTHARCNIRSTPEAVAALSTQIRYTCEMQLGQPEISFGIVGHANQIHMRDATRIAGISVKMLFRPRKSDTHARCNFYL